MKIATTTADMKGYAKTPAEAVKLYEGTGFKHLDYNFYDALREGDPLMTDAWRDVIAEAKAAADSLGMDFVQAHAPGCRVYGGDMQREILATTRAVEACGMLGIRNMVMHSGFLPGYTYPDDMPVYCEAIAPFFRALIPVMEKHQVHILFENTTEKHCRGGNFFPIYARDLNAMVEYFHHPLFGAAWDVGHANMDDIDHAAQFCELGKNLRAIHVHDNYGEKDLHLLPLMGSTDYDNIMQGLLQTGFDGYFTLEIKNNFFFERRKGLAGPLAHPPIAIKKAAMQLQYAVAKAVLEAYGVYEE